MPLVALLVLAAVALGVARRVPGTPAGRLHASTLEVSGDLAAGRLTAVWARIAGPARRPQAARTLEVVGGILRGGRFRVLEVDAVAGRSIVLWEGSSDGPATFPRPRRLRTDVGMALGLVLAWTPLGDGTWVLTDLGWAS